MLMKKKIDINANKNYKGIKKEIQEITNILEESKLKDKLFRYEIVRLNGTYNMFSQEARQLVGLDIEDYTYIIHNYSELMKKYPEIRRQALSRLEYIKSANIAKTITTKGCKNCIQIVSNKLDVKLEDLCNDCKKILMQYTT